MPYVATINTPGFLPWDIEPPIFLEARDAWQYLVEQVERDWDYFPEDENGGCLEAHTQMHNIDQSAPGEIYAPTPGYLGGQDLGIVYSVNKVEEPMYNFPGYDDEPRTAKSALQEWIDTQELNLDSDETETLYQFTQYNETPEFNLKAIDAGAAYGGIDLSHSPLPTLIED